MSLSLDQLQVTSFETGPAPEAVSSTTMGTNGEDCFSGIRCIRTTSV